MVGIFIVRLFGKEVSCMKCVDRTFIRSVLLFVRSSERKFV